jgi:hypothetical protein
MAKLKMVEKNGKSVPHYAADGIGKMKNGGMAKSGYMGGGMAKSGYMGGGMAKKRYMDGGCVMSNRGVRNTNMS